MDINRKNYEEYFIDYFDGKLAPAETADLLLFLEQNTDLKEEFEDFENLSIPAEEITYPNKSKLQKTSIRAAAGITATNFEDYFIAYHEGDLNEKEKHSLHEFLSLNPVLQKDFRLFGSLKLKADTNNIYSEKQKLKKKAAVFSLFSISSSAVAATILLLIGYWFFFSSEKQPEAVREAAAIATMTSIQIPDNIRTSPASENYPIAERKEIRKISNPEISIEKADIFRMESIAMQQAIEDNSIDAHIPGFIYKRFDRGLNLQEMYAEAPEKEKTLTGKIISNAANSLVSVFTSNVEEMELEKVTNFNIWDLAEAGIASYNALADREVVMFRELDKNGRLVSVAILGENLDYRREIR